MAGVLISSPPLHVAKGSRMDPMRDHARNIHTHMPHKRTTGNGSRAYVWDGMDGYVCVLVCVSCVCVVLCCMVCFVGVMCCSCGNWYFSSPNSADPCPSPYPSTSTASSSPIWITAVWITVVALVSACVALWYVRHRRRVHLYYVSARNDTQMDAGTGCTQPMCISHARVLAVCVATTSCSKSESSR